MQEGFSDGAVADVLRQCRTDDNRLYTPGEVQSLMADFDDERKTLNMPYCCTPGANMLRSSFIRHFGDLGNDIEVCNDWHAGIHMRLQLHELQRIHAKISEF